jgi:hypothetical protein
MSFDQINPFRRRQHLRLHADGMEAGIQHAWKLVHQVRYRHVLLI